MDTCKVTRFPNGIEVGGCLILLDGTELIIEESVETVQTPYTVEDEDVVLRVEGTGNVTIPTQRLAKVTIYSVDGLDFVDENSDPLVIENKPSNITAGNSWTFYWDDTLAGYFVG